MIETDTPYVIRGEIYSSEENLINPASLKSCVFYFYNTNAYKGFQDLVKCLFLHWNFSHYTLGLQSGLRLLEVFKFQLQ